MHAAFVHFFQNHYFDLQICLSIKKLNKVQGAVVYLLAFLFIVGILKNHLKRRLVFCISFVFED